MKAREDQKALEERIIENKKDYQKALNDMAASPSGALVLRTLIKACGVFTPKKGIDGVTLIETNTLRNLYLEFIRPYLEPQNKIDLER